MPGVVLVEGNSDRRALEALAARQGLDLAARDISIVAMGGAKNIARFLRERAPDVHVAGLCDAGEAEDFQRAIEGAGLGRDLSTAGMERLGFYVCTADLEDELIRALGTDAVVDVIAAQGDLESFRLFANQPAQRDRAQVDRLRRFMGTRSGRKEAYARALVDALDLGRLPRPLAAVLSHIWRVTGPATHPRA
jgi:hypothetical protein